LHRFFDSGDNIYIGTAATEIAAHQFTYLLLRACAALAHQSNCRTDLARRTITALQGIMLNKGLLQRVERTMTRKSFDRRYALAVLHDSQRKARIEAHTIYEHSAGTTLSMVASLLSASKEQLLAQEVKKSGPREKFKLPQGPIDRDRDRHLGWQAWHLALVIHAEENAFNDITSLAVRLLFG
jgi:hypothetical protein